ncbi:CHAT domain-containing protein [Dyadobacter flavalbus]|uniref:CHAT domain-containing protein n=1 Tax=Dyadobacter flavalbus TaxID=2579942 RepID=UPI0013763127|nr:CHAT domain-containing protein [Dyadobacter flavalbus]
MLKRIEENTTVPDNENLEQLLLLQQSYLKCNLVKDSIYARILHRTGGIYSKTGDIEKAILFTKEAIAVNRNSKKADVSFLANSYFNLGTFYSRIYHYGYTHRSLDECVAISKKFPSKYFLAFMAYEQKAYLFFQTGDYEKGIETADEGILFARKIKDVPAEGALLCQKAQAQIELKDSENAEINIQKAISIFHGNAMYSNRLATAYAVYAQFMKKNGNDKTAVKYYLESYKLNELTGNWAQCSRDMLNLGYLYDSNLHDTSKALNAYEKGMQMADKSKDDYQKSGLFINMGFLYHRQKDLDQALRFYQKALNVLPVHFTNTSITSNPDPKMLMLVSNDYFISTLLSNKAEALLDLYKIRKDKMLLKTALETFRLADKAVDLMRWKQYGEQSKLHWREKTNRMYEHAIEACYLFNDVQLAFFFMEKSRAVLLNDQLNELGASAKLPIQESEKEYKFRAAVINAQQKWTTSTIDKTENEKMQAEFLNAKTNFDHYIKTLEQKYPAYYQYKYSSEVPDLNTLQKYLSTAKASFVHYFMNDSVTYMLKVTARDAELVKLTKEQFDPCSIDDFTQMCSEKQTLINHYNDFAFLSNKLYKSLVQPLKLQTRKVIICADHFLIPFEAFSKDKTGKALLLKDHVFNYVYSAGYLLKDFGNIPAKGNFAGFAPSGYQQHLKVTDLKNAAFSLEKAAGFYHRTRLFTNEEATKSNFIHNIRKYNIVNVFSHAKADKNWSEPMLYMQDSVIRLSELQLLNHQVATRLVILSACETNAGKSAAGEGIYSLARGFTMAGIPSIAATLWKADEQAIYDISIHFHKYLAQGLSKDKALQKAKIDFIAANNIEKSLPYYWANLILIGNPEPINLAGNSILAWLIPVLIALVILSAIIFYKSIYYRENKRYHQVFTKSKIPNGSLFK